MLRRIASGAGASCALLPGGRPACSSASRMNASYQGSTSASSSSRARRNVPSAGCGSISSSSSKSLVCTATSVDRPVRAATSSQKIRVAGNTPFAAPICSPRSSTTRASSTCGLVRHRQQKQWVGPERRGPHRGADHLVVLEHGDEPARDTVRPRNTCRPLTCDALGHGRDDRAQDRPLCQMVTRDGQELGRVVEETQLHPRRLETPKPLPKRNFRPMARSASGDGSGPRE